MKRDKIIWTPGMNEKLKAAFGKMNNKAIALMMGISLSALRPQLYALGLYRMQLDYWTDDQVDFVRNNYQEMGDTEIALIFDYVCPKNKPWTLKHIEKKRKYLGIKRTATELLFIKKRNTELGLWSFSHWKRWDGKEAPIGTVKVWSSRKKWPYKVIKTKDGFVHYAHWLYEQHFGPMPDTHVVGFKDRNNMNVVIENLEAITRGEHASRNAKKYPDDLKDMMKALKQLNKTIKQHTDGKEQ